MRPVFIAITGPTGAGKTYFTNHLIQYLDNHGIDSVKISTDEFYHDLSHMTMEERNEVNYDHPDSISETEFLETIKKLRQNEPVEIPIYDFTTHTRVKNETRKVNPEPIVIIEGIFALVFNEIVDLLDIKIYIDLPSDLRLIRRVKRDKKERGRSVESVFNQYTSSVRPTQKRYIQNQKSQADMILHGDKDHEIIFKLIYKYIIN